MMKPDCRAGGRPCRSTGKPGSFRTRLATFLITVDLSHASSVDAEVRRDLTTLPFHRFNGSAASEVKASIQSPRCVSPRFGNDLQGVPLPLSHMKHPPCFRSLEDKRIKVKIRLIGDCFTCPINSERISRGPASHLQMPLNAISATPLRMRAPAGKVPRPLP
jgi:hypothetical protein